MCRSAVRHRPSGDSPDRTDQRLGESLPRRVVRRPPALPDTADQGQQMVLSRRGRRSDPLEGSFRPILLLFAASPPSSSSPQLYTGRSGTVLIPLAISWLWSRSCWQSLSRFDLSDPACTGATKSAFEGRRAERQPTAAVGAAEDLIAVGRPGNGSARGVARLTRVPCGAHGVYLKSQRGRTSSLLTTESGQRP